jgi:Skp family chaperone for outer membrane proteins
MIAMFNDIICFLIYFIEKAPSFWSAIAGAFIGGLFTAFAAIYSTNRAYKNQLVTSQENEKNLINALLQSIHDEIETVSERYGATLAPEIDKIKEGEILPRYYPLGSDYFTVYNSNAHLLGRIPDHGLIKQIIITYTMSKGMVDSLQQYSDRLLRYENLEGIFLQTQNPIHRQQADMLYATLAADCQKLKVYQGKSKQETDKLLNDLKSYLSTNCP